MNIITFIGCLLLGHLLARYGLGLWRAWRKDRAWSRFQRQHQGAMARAELRGKTLVLVLLDRAEDGR